jgi:rubrerythrin
VDSKKHAGLYKTAAYIMEGKSLSIMDLEFEELEKHLKLHIEKEQEMIDAAKGLMDEVEDQRVKKILTWIYEDELFHHPMLKVLLEVVLKREMISEEDVWDMVFRDLPTHGHAPDPNVGVLYG